MVLIKLFIRGALVVPIGLHMLLFTTLVGSSTLADSHVGLWRAVPASGMVR